MSRTSRGYARRKLAVGAIAVALLCAVTVGRASPSEPSQCHGTVARGSLESGWRLPRRGPNFRAYSDVGWGIGRTWVHSEVHGIVLEAYRRLEGADGGRTWVYGETGWPSGGRLRPHRTHQNGLSVDFMVPLVDPQGHPVELPTSADNRYGYEERFDDTGRGPHGRIDFDAVGMHLDALRGAAADAGVGISKVIFTPALQRHLRPTRAWSHIRTLPFTRRPVWVRHDNHYHVDFAVPCS